MGGEIGWSERRENSRGCTRVARVGDEALLWQDETKGSLQTARMPSCFTGVNRKGSCNFAMNDIRGEDGTAN